MHGHAEAGVYCQEFAQYIATGAEGIPFEGKVTAIEVVTLSLIPRILNFNQAVILIDSKEAIQAVTTNITPKVPSITECRQML